MLHHEALSQKGITDFYAAVDYIVGLFGVSDIVTFDEWYPGRSLY
jgi:hypothetical protein